MDRVIPQLHMGLVKANFVSVFKSMRMMRWSHARLPRIFNFLPRECTCVFSDQLCAWTIRHIRHTRKAEILCASDSAWSDWTTDWTTCRKSCTGGASLPCGCRYASSCQTSGETSCHRTDTQTGACPSGSACELITSTSAWSFYRMPCTGMVSCSNARSYAASGWSNCWKLSRRPDSNTAAFFFQNQ